MPPLSVKMHFNSTRAASDMQLGNIGYADSNGGCPDLDRSVHLGSSLHDTTSGRELPRKEFTEECFKLRKRRMHGTDLRHKNSGC